MYVTDRDIASLDAIRKTVDSVALSTFRNEDGKGSDILSDNDFFRKVAELRAFSAARSNLVSAMIKDGAMERAFSGFDVEKAAQLDAKVVLAQHWRNLKAMRFKRKVPEILQAAQAIAKTGREFGGFWKYLAKWHFPERVGTAEDIKCFWESFDALRNDLKSRRMPIIENEVTLLHFLENDMHLDCLKPDVVVMRVATNVGLVPPKGKGRNRTVVSKVQEYCTQRDVRPSMVDRYLLAFGGQTWAQSLVQRSYCTKLGSCASPDCPVGTDGICPTWRDSK